MAAVTSCENTLLESKTALDSGPRILCQWNLDSSRERVPDFRLQVHELVGFSLVEENETVRVGNLSLRSVKGPKRVNGCILSDCKKVECSGFVIYYLKEMKSSKQNVPGALFGKDP